jgi:hypothetical protein
VCASVDQLAVGERDHNEHLHLQLEDWDAAPPALDGFWNGDMEMT